MTKTSIRVILSIAALLLAACGGPGAGPSQLTPVTVQLNWLHYGNFGGLYAAQQNGLYEQEGLNVEFLEGGPEIDYIGSVLQGEAQFGVAGADDLLVARAQGKPVKAIAVVLRRSPIVFVAERSTGIDEPDDFRGKTIRITPQLRTSFDAMMEAAGVPEDAYDTVILPSDLAVFASDAADVWGVYFSSFAISLQNAGYELNYIWPSDYGVHFYSDSIFTTDRMIEENPDLVLRFLRATLRGMTFAIENPDAIGAMVTIHDPNANPALENAKMAASLPLMHSGQQPMGWMEPAVWQGMYATLHEQGVITAPLTVESAYTARFLEEIYE